VLIYVRRGFGVVQYSCEEPHSLSRRFTLWAVYSEFGQARVTKSGKAEESEKVNGLGSLYHLKKFKNWYTVSKKNALQIPTH
jgi:hypothetical protein